MTDVEGKRYLDLLSAYSALNFGHLHPALVAAAQEQLGRLTLTSRAYHNDRLGAFAAALAELCGKDLVLPMNTGAEAVETGIKVARAWGYRVKGITPDRATIIVAGGNFHGRTTTIVGFSDDASARDDFGPYAPGFVTVPFGDAAAIEAAIDENTAAVLIEPVQGEAGVVVPPEGYLRAVREITERNNVLFIADEIQSGLGRVGETFACDREGVVPDLYLLGKALGGGILPLSAVVGNTDVLGVIRPGEHGSTFGGNPLAAAVGLRVVEMLSSGEFQQRARALGEHLEQRLERAHRPRRDRRAHRGPVGRRRHRPRRGHRPRGRRAPARARRARQGHARPDHPHGPAARHPRDRARLGRRAAAPRPRGLTPPPTRCGRHRAFRPEPKGGLPPSGSGAGRVSPLASGP